MTFVSLGTALLLCIAAFVIGGLPVIGWLVQGLAKQRLQDLGTGNISVSAAFYHGGTAIGILAVLSEALKGIAVVLLARSLFPIADPWEIVALIALVLGRFLIGRGAGTTNVVWGYVAHDWVIAGVIFVLSGGLFALIRRRQLARFAVLAMIPVAEAWRRPESPATIIAATGLSLLLAWIYTQMADDLALAPNRSSSGAHTMFHYLRGRDVIASLNDPPDASKMGHKAATLAQLKQWGYAVPEGWILPIASAARSLVIHLQAVESEPWQSAWIVRSSALDEDRDDASAAGQYQSIADIRSPEALEQAVATCRDAYYREGAVQYRRDRGLVDQPGLPLLVQKHVLGRVSGVAFSRDPVTPGEAVLVEALAGGAELVVSGHVTPDQFRVEVDEAVLSDLTPAALSQCDVRTEVSPASASAISAALIQQAANLARDLERRYHGIPQDIEWTFDGATLWLLQARPITTLAPIWTRKIAAEVIPGVIRPLTWSINRPLTCGVWGQIFTVVLGDRSKGLDFTETATLHYSRAYFNATLLGQIFRRMGLPPESLEFLTLGTKFSQPPILSTLQNVPGLLRLLRREWHLVQDFERDDRQHFCPFLEELHQTAPAALPPRALIDRIERILVQLEKATYYSILAPLSFALRRSLWQVSETALDQRQQPEVASLQAVKALALQGRQHFPELTPQTAATSVTTILFERLASLPEAQYLLQELDAIIQRYGYLSEVGTDIAVPTWREDPQPVRDLFAQFWFNPPPATADSASSSETRAASSGRDRQVQARLDLKGRVAEVYLRLLAELRWSLLALEQQAIAHEVLSATGDGFFLTYGELRQAMATPDPAAADCRKVVAERRSCYEQHQALTHIPFVVYGNDPPPDPTATGTPPPQTGVLQGIGASAGAVQGPAKVLHSLQVSAPIPPGTIIVVPYTDAGWAPILAQAAGLIAEVGGRLSHGAIVAREYNIPAVMNIANATQHFQDGQMVRIDGRAGTVELIDPEP
jgi:phosphohistidine swiveling domain-containing protein/glycerol-3-phosphate acyltransferase PlsY